MNKELENFRKFLTKNVGIILSYGDTNSVMPVGMFCASNISEDNIIVNQEGNKDFIIEFVSIIDDKNKGLILDKTQKIYIPLREFLKKYSSAATQNEDKFHADFGYESYYETINIFKKEIEDYLVKNPNLSYQLEKIPLDDLSATYISNGEIRGNNYSVMPFNIGMIKRKELILEMYNDELENTQGGMRR